VKSAVEALVCVNDRVASTVIQSFLVRKVAVPAEVRIVGIDDLPWAALLPVPLTTVRQPVREIGETALRTMLERIDRPSMPPRDILLDGELIVRKSCGASRLSQRASTNP
jgi:DNA-binding LacI/PurR family transcriptional regulator